MGKAQISSENMDFMLEMMRKLELDKKLKEEGKSEEKCNIAKKLLDILDDETIAVKVGISVAEVKKIKEQINLNEKLSSPPNSVKTRRIYDF